MPDMAASLKLNLTPTMDVAKINAIIAELKNALGGLMGNDIKMLDANKLKSEFAAIEPEIVGLESAIRNVETESAKAGEKIGENIQKGTHHGTERAKESLEKFKENFAEVGKTMLGVFGGGALLGGVSGLTGGIEHMIESGHQLLEVNEQIEVGFKGAGLSGEKLEEQLKHSGDQASVLANKFGMSIMQIKQFQGQAATIGGATGLANDKITELVAGIQKMSNGTIDSTQILRAFSKGLNDPEAQASLGRLTMQFPALATALKGVKDPAEMTNKALAALKPQFDAIAGSDLTKLDNAKNAFKDFQATAGADLLTAFMPALTGVAEAMSGMMKILKPLIDGFTAFAKTPIGTVTTVLLAITGAGLLLAPVITGLGFSFAGTWAAALGPIALVIAGVAAVGAIFYELYNHVTFIKTGVDNLWLAVQTDWNFIKAATMVLVSGITAEFRMAWDLITNIVNGLSKAASDVMHGHFSAAAKDIKGMGTNIATSFSKDFADGSNNIASSLELTKGNVKAIKPKIDENTKAEQHHEDQVKKTNAQYQAQAKAAGDVKDELKKGFENEVSNIKNILAIKRLSAEDYNKLYNSLSDAQQKKSLADTYHMNDAEWKAKREQLNKLLSAQKKLNTDTADIDKKYSLDAEKTSAQKTKDILSQYDTQKKIIDEKLKENNLDAEHARLLSGRAKSTVDDIAAVDRQTKALEDQRKELLMIHGVSESNGNLNLSPKIAEKDRTRLSSEWQAITNGLKEQGNKKLELTAKISIERESLIQQLSNLDKEKLKMQISLGIKKEDALLPILQKEFDDASQKMNAMKNQAGDFNPATMTNEQLKAYEEQQKTVMNAEQALFDAKKKIQDAENKAIEEAAKKDMDMSKKKYDAEKSYLDLVTNVLQKTSSQVALNEQAEQMKKLDEMKQKGYMTDVTYNNRKAALEKETQNKITLLQNLAEGQRLELEKKKQLADDEIKRKELQSKLDVAKKSGDAAGAKDLSKQLDELNTTINQKKSVISSSLEQMKSSIAEGITGMFAGNPEAMHDSLKKTMQVLAGALEAQLSGFVLGLILSKSTVDFLAALPFPLNVLSIPIITATVNGAVSALANPLISQLTSFSTGGRVDSPSLVVAGDASKATGGSNTEWIVRDRDIQRLMATAITSTMSYIGFDQKSNPLMLQIQQQNISVSKSLDTIDKTIANIRPMLDGGVANAKTINKFLIDRTQQQQVESAFYAGNLSEAAYTQQMMGLGAIPNLNVAMLQKPTMTPIMNLPGKLGSSNGNEMIDELRELRSEVINVRKSIDSHKDIYVDGKKITGIVNQTNNIAMRLSTVS